MAAILWSLVQAALITGIAWVVGGLLAGVAHRLMGRTSLDPIVRRLVVGLVRPVILFAGLIAALDRVGVDLTTLVALVGAAGLAIGLSLRESLSNVAAGAIVLTLRPFRGGDVVEIGGVTGTVLELGLLTTTLRNATGVVVTVPNNLLVKGPISNFTIHGTRRIDLFFRVAYDADVSEVRTLLRSVVAGNERVLADPAPLVKVASLGELGVEMQVSGWVPTADFIEVQAALADEGLAALREAGVRIPIRSTSAG